MFIIKEFLVLSFNFLIGYQEQIKYTSNTFIIRRKPIKNSKLNTKHLIYMPIHTDKFTFGEELANAISHITGAVLSAIALVFMMIYAGTNGMVVHILSATIFGLSMVLLYFASGFMHWLPLGKAKKVFRKLDQIGIFLLIAGTYTPFALLAIKGAMGWWIFGLEWGLAFIGIIIKSLEKEKLDKNVNIIYIIVYLFMGWLLVVDVRHIIEVLEYEGFAFLIGGGLFYSIGVIFFRMHKVRYHHLVWHLFVMLGTAMHVIAVYYYVLPIH